MKKNGFSLVELLAVIVILGVIAVITSPVIMGVIEDSRQSAFKSSLNGVKKAIENDYSDHNFDTNRKYYYGGYQNGTGGASDKKLVVLVGPSTYEEIEMSGEVNGKGMGSVNSSGSIAVGLYTDQFCGVAKGNDVEVKKIDSEISVSDCIAWINGEQY